MSKILDEVKRILKEIDIEGISINNTQEINNVISEFYPMKTYNIKTEKIEVADFYNSKIGDWEKRLSLEKDHYKFLETFIIHKVKENQYFFNLKPDDFTSRKNVIFSNDCISAIQFLSRPNQNIMNIFIRSSDALNLLCADFLGMIEIFDKVLKRFKIKRNKIDKITFFITSCHTYHKDKLKVDKILKNG